MRLFSALHAALARLHGGMPDKSVEAESLQGEAFEKAYGAYASATTLAYAMLQEHGAGSPEFTSADVASMRLFHRVKKMQGLRKPRDR